MPSHPFRLAIEARDRDAVAETLSERITLHSPVFFKPLQGREPVVRALEMVDQVIGNDLRYVDELVGDSSVMLKFETRIGELELQLQGIDYLTLDEEGSVERLTVFMRPFSALSAFREAMLAKVEAATA